MSVVGLWTAKLIVGHRPELIVLEETAAPVVAHQNVQLAVRSKTQHAAVVVSTQRLTSVGLIGAQLDQVAIKDERGAIPEVTIDADSQATVSPRGWPYRRPCCFPSNRGSTK